MIFSTDICGPRGVGSGEKAREDEEDEAKSTQSCFCAAGRNVGGTLGKAITK